MKTLRTRAIVLRRVNYGEADRIIHLITPEGRLNVMARGVRREKSKLAGGIELFAVSDIVVVPGKGDLGILTSARLVNFYRHILEDYDRTQFAYEVLKEVSRASETLDDAAWHDTVLDVLEALDVPSLSLDLIKVWFYLRYSALLGYELNALRDSGGEKLEEAASYRYDDTEKGYVQAQNGEIGAAHIKLLRLAAVKPLKTLAQVGGIEMFLPTCLNVARRHAAI